MRKIILVAAVSVFVPTLGWAQSATVNSGAKSQITTHFRIDSQCRPSRVEIKVLAAPANGTVTSEPKDVVVPAQNQKGKQPAQCVGKTVAGVAVFYQSKAGFKGNDSLRYLRFNPNDANDRYNTEVSYTITVK